MRIFSVIKNIPDEFYHSQEILYNHFDENDVIIYSDSTYQKSITFSAPISDKELIEHTLKNIIDEFLHHSGKCYMVGIFYDQKTFGTYGYGKFYSKFEIKNQSFLTDDFISNSYDKNIKFFEERINHIENEIIKDMDSRSKIDLLPTTVKIF